MENQITEIIFPVNTIEPLVHETQGIWRSLAQESADAPPGSARKIAFIVMMARLNNCATCNSVSMRALSGCIACARQTIRRFRGTESELNNAYQIAQKEASAYLMRSIKTPNPKLIKR